MCGLVAITSNEGSKELGQEALMILRRLEYRGYDSAGILLGGSYKPCCIRKVGEVDRLIKDYEDNHKDYLVDACIAHTRWATTGKVSENNCHPVHSWDKEVSLVHNGIIENVDYLKSRFESQYGNKFQELAETDTQILVDFITMELHKAGLISRDCELNLDPLAIASCIESTLINHVKGTYGLAILIKGSNVIYAFSNGSPIIIGKSDKCSYVCSDINALNGIAYEAMRLTDGTYAVLKGSEVIYQLETSDSTFSPLNPSYVIDKGNYESFTLKEIHEQVHSINQTLAGRFTSSGDVRISAFEEYKLELKNCSRIYLVGEGTSYHAALLGKYLIEKHAQRPVDVLHSSEVVLTNFVTEPNSIAIFISQSGETADTLNALNEFKQRDVLCMGITNGIGSQLSELTDFGVYLRCGVEVGVASTKAFTSMVAVLGLLTARLSRMNWATTEYSNTNIISQEYKLSIPDYSQSSFVTESPKYRSIVFLGRGLYHYIAMEAALKMTELTYIPCLSYPLGSLKHGPLSIVADDILFVILSDNEEETQTCSNELKCRGANIVHCIQGPNNGNENNDVYKILNMSIHIQMFAYEIAKYLGRSIDKPRNLAKSVTVK